MKSIIALVLVALLTGCGDSKTHSASRQTTEPKFHYRTEVVDVFGNTTTYDTFFKPYFASSSAGLIYLSINDNVDVYIKANKVTITELD